MKIVFLDGYTINPGDLTWDLMESVGDFEVYDRTATSQIVDRCRDAEIVIVNKTPLTAQVFSQLPKLKLVCVAATGFDNVDLEAARTQGVLVCNCRGYSSECVAQMTLSLVLEAADSVGSYVVRNHEGAWNNSADFCYTIRPRFELFKKKIAIIGFGNIGKRIAEIMYALRMDVYAVTSKTQEELPDYVTPVTLEEAFATCDVVSLNCPLTALNRGFVNKALLDKAKPGLILVNTARGGLINEHDVAEALFTETLGAYCTDVLSEEPPRHLSPIIHAPRAFVTPHIAWNTPESRMRIMQILVDNIQAFVTGNPQNIVN